MAKCDCCNEREADMTAKLPTYWAEDIIGARYSELCLNEFGYVVLAGMIRARRATLAAAPSLTSRHPLLDIVSSDGGITWGADVAPIAITSKEQAEAVWGVGSFCSGVAGAFLDDFTKPPTCRECSKPERPVVATMGAECSYCHLRVHGVEKNQREQMDLRKGAMAASDRLAAFDKRNTPRQTAESRELAKAHPWSCDENEP